MLSEVRSFRDGNAEFILLVDEMEIYLIVGRYKADRLTSEWILLARDPTWRKTHIIAKCGEDEAIQVTYVEFIHRLPLMAPLVFDLSPPLPIQSHLGFLDVGLPTNNLSEIVP